MYTYLQTEQLEEISIVYINKQETLNALDMSLLKELDNYFTSIEDKKEIKTVILTGRGKSFVAGADIKQMSLFNKKEALEFSKFGASVFRKIETSNKIVIAAINGYAIGGGCELALACDIRIASESVVFAQPELSLGIIPGFSATQRLPKVVGISKAKEIIFSGKKIKAQEAKEIGLISDITSQESLLEYCIQLAHKINKNPYNVLINAKQSINKTSETFINEGMNKESELFADCFENYNQKEGMQAFLDKRQAVFR